MMAYLDRIAGVVVAVSARQQEQEDRINALERQLATHKRHLAADRVELDHHASMLEVVRKSWEPILCWSQKLAIWLHGSWEGVCLQGIPYLGHRCGDGHDCTQNEVLLITPSCSSRSD